MPRTPTAMSLAEVCELPSGSWVNDGFIAIVDGLERKTSKPPKNQPFWVLTLRDTTGSASVECAIFTAPKFRQNDKVEFTGKGIKFEVGQYGPKISIGRDTEIHVLTATADTPPATPRRAPLDDERGGNPPETDNRSFGQTFHPQGTESEDRGVAFHQKMKANAALYLQCLSYARKIQTTLKAGNFPEMAPDHFQACVSTLFIAGDRQGLGIMPPPFGEPAQSAPPPARRAAKVEQDDSDPVPF